MDYIFEQFLDGEISGGYSGHLFQCMTQINPWYSPYCYHANLKNFEKYVLQFNRDNYNVII